MKSNKTIRLVGMTMIGLGALGVAYGLYGFYLFFEVSDMLYFLTPDYSGLLLLGVVLAASLFLIYFGYRLVRRSPSG